MCECTKERIMNATVIESNQEKKEGYNEIKPTIILVGLEIVDDLHDKDNSVFPHYVRADNCDD